MYRTVKTLAVKDSGKLVYTQKLFDRENIGRLSICTEEIKSWQINFGELIGNCQGFFTIQYSSKPSMIFKWPSHNLYDNILIIFLRILGQYYNIKYV